MSRKKPEGNMFLPICLCQINGRTLILRFYVRACSSVVFAKTSIAITGAQIGKKFQQT